MHFVNSYKHIGNRSVVLALSMQLFVGEIQDFLRIYKLYFLTIRGKEIVMESALAFCMHKLISILPLTCHASR